MIVYSGFLFGMAVATAFWLGMTVHKEQVTSFGVGICMGAIISTSLWLIGKYSVNFMATPKMKETEHKMKEEAIKHGAHDLPASVFEDPSLLEQIGGQEKFAGIIDLLFSKILLDPRIGHFYSGVDMAELIPRFKAWCTEKFSGLSGNTTFKMHGKIWVHGKSLDQAHTRLVEQGIVHFDKYCELLQQTLIENGIDRALRGRIMQFIFTQRDVVLGRHNEEHESKVEHRE